MDFTSVAVLRLILSGYVCLMLILISILIVGGVK